MTMVSTTGFLVSQLIILNNNKNLLKDIFHTELISQE